MRARARFAAAVEQDRVLPPIHAPPNLIRPATCAYTTADVVLTMASPTVDSSVSLATLGTLALAAFSVRHTALRV